VQTETYLHSQDFDREHTRVGLSVLFGRVWRNPQAVSGTTGLELRLFVKDNTQQRTIDLESAVVLDETHLLEFAHEKIHSRARCANHFRQRLL
jgi:hypothetical protein